MLQTLGWLACIVYATIPSFWLLIHPRTAYWRTQSRSPYRVLIPLWVGMWILLGIITTPWRSMPLYSTYWTYIPGALLFATGIWIYKRSSREFRGVLLGGLPELRPDQHQQRLVISGIRSRVRHPIYLAHLCEMLGWSIGTGLAVCYALTAFAVVTGAVMIWLEDKELERRFGEEYRSYRRTVPAVLPRI